MVGVDRSPTGWRGHAGAGITASAGGRRLASAPGPAARHRLRGHLRRRAPARTPRATPTPAPARPPHARAPSADGVPAGQRRRAPRRPQHLDDHLRRAGDDPDRARGLAGDPGALRRDRRVDRVALGGTRHPRQHRRVHPHHRECRRCPSAAPSAGKAIIVLNPVDPPMIMRDTVFCVIGPDADHDAIRASVYAMVDAVREYVPGYTHARRAGVRRPEPRLGRQRPRRRCSSRSRATATTCRRTPATSTS